METSAQTYFITINQHFLKNRYGITGIDSWYTKGVPTDGTATMDFTDTYYSTNIQSSNSIYNSNVNVCGTQVYVFVTPATAIDNSNANLVVYNNATGQPILTGTIDYSAF